MTMRLSAASKLFVAVTSAAVLLFGGAAAAHAGEDHGTGEEKVKGTIKSLTDKVMVVTTTDGKDVTLDLMEMTKFERNGKATTAADVSVGEKAVVTTMKGGTSGAHAMAVKLGKKAAGKGAAASKADGGAAQDGGVKTPAAKDTMKPGDKKHDGH